MNQPNTPNIGELLTPEDEVLVKKAVQSSKPAVHSPFEGKSLYLQFTKSISNHNDGLAAWKSFLGKISTKSGETIVQRPARSTQLSNKPKQSMVSDDTYAESSRSPKRSSNLSGPDEGYEASDIGEDRLSDRLSPETSRANNIPYGIPRSEEDLVEEKPILKPKLKLPEIPRRSVDVPPPPLAKQERVKHEAMLKEKERLALEGKEEDRGIIPSPENIAKEYGGYIYSIANKFTGNSAEAEDIMQEVLMKYVTGEEKAEKLRGNNQLKTKLYKEIKNAFIDAQRKKNAGIRDVRRTQGMKDKEGKNVDQVDPNNMPPDERLASEEVRQKYIAALHKLPNTPKQPFQFPLVMKFYGDEENADPELRGPWSFEQIAQVMGVPVNTAKTYVQRGKRWLQEHLGAEFEDLKFGDDRPKPIDR